MQNSDSGWQHLKEILYEGSRWRMSSLLQMWILRGEITLQQEIRTHSLLIEGQSGPGRKSKLLKLQGAHSESGAQ